MTANGQYTQGSGELVLAEPALGWPGGYLQARAARAWWAIKAWFKVALGLDISFNEGYRPLATQVYYFNLYLAGKGNPAAKPGTSKHGDGWAWDLNSPFNSWLNQAQVAWLANEARFGISSAQGRADNEAWHKVNVSETTVAGGGDSTAITNGDSDMPNFYQVTNGRAYYGRYWVPDQDHLGVLQRYDKSARTGAQDTFNAVQQVWIDQALTANGMAPDVAPIVDSAALAAAVTKGVLTGLPAGSDAKAIAAAVDAAVADNFAALPGQVLDLESKRLTS